MEASADNDASRIIDSVWQLVRQRDFQRAVPACQQINQRFPEAAEGWFLTSYLAANLNNPPHALSAIERALAVEPDRAEWLLHRARCLATLGRIESATTCALSLGQSNHENWNLAADTGVLLSSLREYPGAQQAFQRAIELTPDNGRLHFNLSTVHRFLGDIPAARASVEQAITLDPNDYDALFLRSSLRQHYQNDNHIIELRKLIDVGIDSPLGQAQTCYALAKELEDVGDYQASFSALKQGAAARRDTGNYDIDEDLAFINKIEQVYDAELLQSAPPIEKRAGPIFVVGLPRTGSTLVERIVSGHSDATSVGESTNFTRLISGMVSQIATAPNLERGQIVELTAELDFESLGRAYLQQTRPPQAIPLFVDKFPPNALNIGLIRLALPQAKVVLVERHPLDTCFSIYKQLFTDIYEFSYDLTELGQYFIAHQRLMQHWQQLLPDFVYTIRYENLVTDFEAEVRRLIDFCSLSWQDQCLDFKSNPEPSTTASASQVRQALYSSSIGNWRNHQTQLQGLEEQLQQAGCLDDWP